LFVTKEGRIKILDFGLAKISPLKETPDELAPTITRRGVAVGTVEYMSPEQVRGQDTDHRTDIFAFGAILYEMVVGQRSFQKQTEADTISAILTEAPPPLSQLSADIPVALQKIVDRCLEKNPEQRFQSASDLAFALKALSDSTISSPAIDHEKQGPNRVRFVSVSVLLLIVLGSAIAVYLALQTPPEPKVSNYVQLTHDGQRKSLIGTDGLRLYLALGGSGNSGPEGFAEMSILGGEPRRTAILPSASMVPVALSPDGSEILVVNGQGAPPRGPLWRIPILGGSPRKLGDMEGEAGAWSPDGKSLAYSHVNDLFVAKADGTESRKLLSMKGEIKNVTYSPDNSHLRFDTSETAGSLGKQLIWDVSVDGTELQRLLAGWHDGPDECCGKWTADGKYFIFQSNHQIWALRQKSSFIQAKPRPVPLTSSPLALSFPIPSRDGKKLFVIGQTYRGELMRYDGKAGRVAPFLEGISAEYVAFSKDGQSVAYVSYPEGTLWRNKLDGSERLQLTYPPMDPVLPRWSPDGKKIVFFEYALSADKPARIYEVSSESGTPRQLMPDDRQQQLDPNWSPDGSKIVYGGRPGDAASSIRIFDLGSHQLSTLPDSLGLFSPRWSPNGRYILATSADSMKLLLFDFQIQKWAELARGSMGWPTWSKDGRSVYVLHYEGKGAVLRIRISDHKAEKIVDLNNFTTGGRYGAWLGLAPDDSPLLLRDAGSQDVYALDWEAP
jgi:Tol biopolymer transport system component